MTTSSARDASGARRVPLPLCSSVLGLLDPEPGGDSARRGPSSCPIPLTWKQSVCGSPRTAAQFGIQFVDGGDQVVLDNLMDMASEIVFTAPTSDLNTNGVDDTTLQELNEACSDLGG